MSMAAKRSGAAPVPEESPALGEDRPRCAWCLSKNPARRNPRMIDYHDREWGVPVHDDVKHFEFLVLDAFQAGLSWEIVLNKRDGFRKAFAGFDPAKVGRFRDDKVEKLVLDASIVRNRQKIVATIDNAKRFQEVQAAYGSFDAFVWSFVGGKPLQPRRKHMGEIPATSLESDAMSKALTKLKFRFVGSTICYAYMQAAGMVNDHVETCHRYRVLRGRS